MRRKGEGAEDLEGGGKQGPAFSMILSGRRKEEEEEAGKK
jgi:hypothetical protein